MFEGSISENIARFGDIDATKVVAASQAADVHEMILRLPEGYDTVIGAGGGTLSGGQRQRIGLARALYGDPVLVVLDEPNSNLDDVGEAALAKAIVGLKQKQVTVIVITHRTNILGAMDYLMVLKEGQLAAFDTRDKVLAQLAQAQQPAPAAQPVRPMAPVVSAVVD